MSQYYYTVASLPLLAYDMDRPLSISNFLEICQQQLSQRDNQVLKCASLIELESTKSTYRVLQNWFIWEKSLRNELVKLRAQRRGEELEKYLVESPEILGLQEIARNAFTQDSPLTAEEILNRARWEYFDELEIGHYFDIEKLIVYYLRLRLLERKALFNREKGLTRFNDIYESITKNIYQTHTTEYGNANPGFRAAHG